MTMSLRYVLRTLKVLSPKFVLTPSAMLRGGYWGWTEPFYNESLASRARYGCTPITLVLGLKWYVAIEDPLDKPPPPTGTTK